MVDRATIEHWRKAPRLTSFAAFFERTASGAAGAPDLAEPKLDLSLLDFDLEAAVFSDTHRRLWGRFDSHYFASIPYRLEEENRLGAAILSFALRAWARSGAATTIYTLGTGTGCLARTLATLGNGRIEALCCSPTAANRVSFDANRGSEHAQFFHGPFFELTDERYATVPDLLPFRNGFDLLLEDTTFQMYDRDRIKQLEFVVPRIRPGGVLVQVQKLAHEDREIYEERERQKDDIFKARFFSTGDISKKKEEVLDTMTGLQVDLVSTVTALRTFFRYSVLTWNSGNFYTIVSSNSRTAILELISLMVKPAIPPRYCYQRLPVVIIDTDAEPLAPDLIWRSAKTMVSLAPRRVVS
ncbi:class I SAM-dependent methyltransferase (plasmid) [Ensifer adhaerens]|uniref:class I SAM-dependent methyltransferase n=1 Tax=Ensifer adhaerens TaxID=106592 RepID=UPI001CC16785|nr:class I SAM-dependent methyltransferase [Ensifer adhaerens]MBZ7927608.1 class I SAM-dependent methyltransferase [Ensifer adhaerens]UAX98011.1 class I SAM-dependent methyltransferase [Ensifer adhaerens]UAY05391.1 class I SAM-dependent methyltransferase [Ensifer adhaerens]UAY12769.1 class I SAM-dependent methyltransferase [Ensifer adhaerens]